MGVYTKKELAEMRGSLVLLMGRARIERATNVLKDSLKAEPIKDFRDLGYQIVLNSIGL
jgi:hypothetical protein